MPTQTAAFVNPSRRAVSPKPLALLAAAVVLGTLLGGADAAAGPRQGDPGRGIIIAGR